MTLPLPPSARETRCEEAEEAFTISKPLTACKDAGPRGKRRLGDRSHPRSRSRCDRGTLPEPSGATSVLVLREGTEAQLRHGQPGASPKSGWE